MTSSLSLPRRRLRSLASKLYKLYPSPPTQPTVQPEITVICISDTHCTQPSLPSGDLLLHAGDLSNVGSFDEIQAQLHWLSAQPHKYKVVIAGNHEVLLDPRFLKTHSHWNRASNVGRTAKDLDWGDVLYLQDSSLTLEFDVNVLMQNSQQASGDEKEDGQNRKDDKNVRTLKIFGSPTTPQYGTSAFQVPRTDDVWSHKVPDDTDILLTHGPPYGHLDGPLKSGCSWLAQEVARVRPALVVFGHIHVERGVEEVMFHKVSCAFEGIQGAWKGKVAVVGMTLRVLTARGLQLLGLGRLRSRDKMTRLVNAAVVSGEKYELRNDAIVVTI